VAEVGLDQLLKDVNFNKRKVVRYAHRKLNIYCENKNKFLKNFNDGNVYYCNKELRNMDWRLLIVLLPLLLAAGWAAKNILPVAVKQVQAFLSKANS
jgi:photosystem II PsbY protein